MIGTSRRGAIAALLLSLASGAFAQTLQLRVLASGLDRVTELRHVPAAGTQIYVVEQIGRIRVLQPDGLASAPFLDVRDRVNAAEFEQGLTGLAFAPTFPLDDAFYIHYTRADGASVLSRFRLDDDDPLEADPDSEEVLLVLPQPTSIHNCNKVEFGPDGYLYFGCGDGGPAGAPPENPRALTHLYGKLLRLDVDDVPIGATYGIPGDNPYVGLPGARAEIWARGLRNPYRFEFDPATGDLWLGDVGQTRYEELNHVPAGTPAGVDFGWLLMEGEACFMPSFGCSAGQNLWMPRYQYSHANGRCAIVAGPRLRGEAFGALDGEVVFGDFCSGEIFGLQPSGVNASVRVLLDTEYWLTSFGFGPDGELLAGTFDFGDAKVLRLEPIRIFGNGLEPPEPP
jgi:hypothetical protein